LLAITKTVKVHELLDRHSETDLSAYGCIKGVDTQEILEDYPDLDHSDLEFARLFVRAYPEQDDPTDIR